jgi:hypothetical protein
MMVTPFLQLIERDGDTIFCSAADLQLIRAEHLPNGRDSLGRTSASKRGRSQRNAGVRHLPRCFCVWLKRGALVTNIVGQFLSWR